MQWDNYRRSGDIYDFRPYKKYLTSDSYAPVNTPLLLEEEQLESEEDESSEEEQLEEEEEEEEILRPPSPAPIVQPPPPPPPPPAQRRHDPSKSTSFDIVFTPPAKSTGARPKVAPPSKTVENPFFQLLGGPDSATVTAPKKEENPFARKSKLAQTPPRSTGEAFDHLLFGPQTRSRGPAEEVPLSKTIPERKSTKKK
jgi:hypothetical protein